MTWFPFILLVVFMLLHSLVQSTAKLISGFGAGGEASRAEPGDRGESSISSFPRGSRSSSLDRSPPDTSQWIPSRPGVCWEKNGSRPLQFSGKYVIFWPVSAVLMYWTSFKAPHEKCELHYILLKSCSCVSLYTVMKLTKGNHFLKKSLFV